MEDYRRILYCSLEELDRKKAESYNKKLMGCSKRQREILNRRKDGNNSGKVSSRKERFLNLQRTRNFTSSLLWRHRFLKGAKEGLENGKKFWTRQPEEEMEEVVWVLYNIGCGEPIKKTKAFEKFYNEKYPHSASSHNSLKKVFEESMKLRKAAWVFVQFF